MARMWAELNVRMNSDLLILSLLCPGLILWYCIRPDLFAVALKTQSHWIGVGEGMNRIRVSVAIHKILVQNTVLPGIILRQQAVNLRRDVLKALFIGSDQFAQLTYIIPYLLRVPACRGAFEMG